MEDFKLDINKIKKQASTSSIKVILKKHYNKGMGLFAKQAIKKDEVIAYYKVTIFETKKYDSPTKNVYTFNIYRKNESEIKKYIGDIDDSSFPKPLNNISYLAPFANEPSIGEKSNAEMDLNLEENYKDIKYAKAGEHMVYKLMAIRDIKKGEEILWYYGDDYYRNYAVSKE